MSKPTPAVPFAVVVRIIALVTLLAIGGAFSSGRLDEQRAELILPEAAQYDPVLRLDDGSVPQGTDFESAFGTSRQ